MKRAFDFFAAASGLLLLSPLLLLVMRLVWLQDRHSPLYIAPRVGLGGRDFSMVKLRSMVINADRSGVESTSASDNRITAVGHFIRRYKLDELSQLWNVLSGDMSLVGPRPSLPQQIDLNAARALAGVSTLRPGITGLAQVQGVDMSDVDRLVEIDGAYLKQRTTRLDLRILLGTITPSRIRTLR